MHAEILAIGSELTSGAKLDTNSQWLSLELGVVGVSVRYHTTMADDLPAVLGVLRTAVERSDLLVITGGLGPTLDDLTRQALADLAGVELILDAPSLGTIKAMFARRQRPMPERNVVQAMFPAGSTILPNARGTAPGVWMELLREGRDPCRIAALPGVPSEMRPMFLEHVLPRLPGTGNVIRRHRVHGFGLGESAVEELLGDLTARGHDPEIGITAHEATITLRIDAHGRTEEECREKIARAVAEIRQRLGESVFGEEDEELEHVVVRQLAERGLTVATAESGTGGLLAHRLTQVAEFRRGYLGGLISPTPESRRTLLGVDGTPDGEALARAMAAGCRARCGADFALAITDEPPPDDVASPAAPSLWVALSGPGVEQVEQHFPVGDPAITRSRAAKTALNLLRLHLLHTRK